MTLMEPPHSAQVSTGPRSDQCRLRRLLLVNTLFNRPLKGPTFGGTRTWLCVSPQTFCFLLVEFYRAGRVLPVTGIYCLGRIRRESASD